MRAAHAVVGETRIAGELGRLDNRTHSSELRVVADREKDVSASGMKQVVRRDVRMSVACTPRLLTGIKVVWCVRVQDRQRAIEQRRFDELSASAPLTLTQCHQDAERRVKSADHV